jgi:hypothetical protein
MNPGGFETCRLRGLCNAKTRRTNFNWNSLGDEMLLDIRESGLFLGNWNFGT